MGIPKFFRWMNDRYPGLLATAKESQLPDIDNFYLDMNGIIHNCTHPCDGNVHFRITEAEMFEDIFNYISTLFTIIKPKQYFFMAVDGVAPRAKMNQQRGRRFRTAKEASDREEAALGKGDILPDEQRFDSNCITPGTTFMVKLNNALKDFIKHKLSTDQEWQKVKVILSGHETPGEGEHKVMDFIRHQRSQPDYNQETRHCLYGLDTDLIMLGLSLHEPNFTLLREEIKLNSRKNEATKGKSQRIDPSKITFNILHLSMLRDNIRMDFLPLEPKLSFVFDLESIIDDWILICFLIGNDFIPHIPHFHIHKNALPKLIEVYQTALTKLDGYMNEKGILNLRRFRVFAKMLAEADFENYKLLLKENGGDCAKNDFSKLNMFVKHRIRIPGIHQSQSQRDYFKPKNRPMNPNHHSNYHKPNVWYNIRKEGGAVGVGGKMNGANYLSSRSYHQQHPNNHQYSKDDSYQNGKRGQQISHHNQNHNRFSYQTSGNNQVHHNNANHHHSNSHHQYSTQPHQSQHNGSTNGGRVGVHSFTEEQINNSITVCADGDFIDLSDDEYLSDEKFPGENGAHKNFVKLRGDTAAGNNGLMRGNRSTPKKDRKNVNSSRSDDLVDFEDYKRTYYREKLKLDPDKVSILKVVHEYVRALQWNLHYYYHGCMSWGWFYPYHYAPFISDIANFTKVDTHFELGEPFKPFDQLLSVLPAASSSLLPKMYRGLVTSSESPLAKYFPIDIEYDLNGKQNDWEAVVLAPFIEEESLLKASVLCNLFLTDEERMNNKHGPHLLFEYVGPKSASINSSSRLARNGLGQSTVRCTEIPMDGFFVPQDKIQYGLMKIAKKHPAKDHAVMVQSVRSLKRRERARNFREANKVK